MSDHALHTHSLYKPRCFKKLRKRTHLKNFPRTELDIDSYMQAKSSCKLLVLCSWETVQSAVDEGLLFRLMNWLVSLDYKLQKVSLKIVWNICIHRQFIPSLVSKGYLSIITYLLSSPHTKTLDLTIGVLNRIANENKWYRQLLIYNNCLDKLVFSLPRSHAVSLGVSTIALLCNNVGSYSVSHNVTSLLSDSLDLGDIELQADILQGLFGIHRLTLPILGKVSEYIHTEDENLLLPALKILAKNRYKTLSVHRLKSVLGSSNEKCRLFAVKILAGFCESDDGVCAIVQLGVHTKLIENFQDESYGVKLELLKLVVNSIRYCGLALIPEVSRFLKIISFYLNDSASGVIEEATEVVGIFYARGVAIPRNIVRKIEFLQFHKCDSVYSQAYRVLELIV